MLTAAAFVLFAEIPADVVILTRGQAYGVLAAIGLALVALVATAMF